MANEAEAVPFDYVVVSGSIAASGSAQMTLTLAPDSTFEWHVLEGRSTLDAATTINPNNFSLQMTIQSTGRQMSNLRVPQALMAATAQHQTMMRRPMILPPNSVLLFDILNLDSGNANTVTIVLRGYKMLTR